MIKSLPLFIVLIAIVLFSCNTGTSSNSSDSTTEDSTTVSPGTGSGTVVNDTTAYEKPDYDQLASNISDLESKVSSASSGTVIALKNGTYSNIDLNISKDGVIILAETSGSVFIEGVSTVEISGDDITFEGFTFQNGYPISTSGAIIVSGSYNRITNCKIESFNDSDHDVTYKWVSLKSGTTYNEVDHCTFTGKRTEGSLLTIWRDEDESSDASANANYHHIYRNLFEDYQYVEADDLGSSDTPDDPNNNGWETMRVGTSDYSQSSSYTTVEYNYFYECDGEIEIISNKSGHNTYQYNTFENSAGLLTLRHGNSCTVGSNYFLIDDTSGGGIRIIDKDHTITNNYIEGANSDSSHRGGITVSSHDDNESGEDSPKVSGYWEVKDITISNNTIINSQQSFNYGASEKDNAPTSATISNNLVRNDLDENTTSEVIRVCDNDDESLNIVSPTYSNNYYYGSSLGLSPTPSGINFTSVSLTQNENGQYIADSLTVGASELVKLNSSSDVGCDF